MAALTTQRVVFPHCLTAQDIAGTGPSDWYRCSRPSCRLIYRTLALRRVVPPSCPMCGQPWLAAKHGPVLTRAQREQM